MKKVFMSTFSIMLLFIMLLPGAMFAKNGPSDQQILDKLQIPESTSPGVVQELLKVFRGVPIDQIQPGNSIETYYEVNEASQNELGSSRPAMIEISQSEGEKIFSGKSIQPFGSDPGPTTNWVKFTHSSFTWVGQPNISHTVSFEWKKEPAYKQQDVIAITVSSNMTPMPDSEFFDYSYEKYVSGSWQLVSSRQNRAERNAGGGGYGFTFQVGNPKDLSGHDIATRNHKGSAYLQVNKTEIPGVMANRSGYGHYAHQQSIIGISPSYSLPSGGGFSINNTVSFDKVTTHVVDAF